MRTEAGRDSGENKTSVSARAAAVLIKSLLGCCSSSGFDFRGEREREKEMLTTWHAKRFRSAKKLSELGRRLTFSSACK